MTLKSTPSPTLPHWDLSNIYPGLDTPDFRDDMDTLEIQLDEFDAYLQAHHIPGDTPPLIDLTDLGELVEIVDGYLARTNVLLRRYRTLETYLYAHVATDSYNTTAQRLMSELDMLGVRRHQQTVRFQAWLGGHAERLPQILAQSPQAQAHAFYLQELAAQSRYLMSDAEESLAAELLVSGALAWQKLQGTLCSQLTVPFEQDGQDQTLPITALQNLRYDPDARVRRRAYEAELEAWASVRAPLAAAMNGVKGAAVTLDHRRGREDALHVALDKSRIDRATLEAMLGAIQEALPTFRGYLQAKATRLGHDALPWWDLFAPVGQVARRLTYPEAQDFIVTQFGTFSERLAQFAQRAFTQRWIDAEPRQGKRGGAFCIGIPAVEESRVLCNFDGSLDQVFTLAHELGHAYHNECRSGKTMLQRITPMTMAETASIFCETIVTDAMLAQATDAEEELAILETFLVGATQVTVDITSRYLFEKAVFEQRERAELSADDFCDLMLEAQAATYGDGLDARYRHPYMWAWKPHYYSVSLPFYNYPYAFGLLFGLGLYTIYQEQGEAFLPRYDALLANTGEGQAADLAAQFGIDIRQPDFWRGSLQLIAARIARYQELS